MNKEEVKDLAKKFLAGMASADEQEKLHGWSAIDIDDQEEVVFTSVPEHAEEVKSRLIDRIKVKINMESLPKAHKIRTSKLWYGISAAAAVLLVVGATVYFYSTGFIFKDDLADAKNIFAGKNTAILTLANGKQIDLSDAKNGHLAEEAGLRIQKAADGQLVYEVIDNASVNNRQDGANTVSTPKGGQYQVVLPDGTNVWLNAASSISFPSTFANAVQRKVRLKGEAYFEVAKDRSHPFVVETDKQQVEVLGTHFNVNAYEDEGSTKTTLLEGSVKVGPSRDLSGERQERHFLILKPGQQSRWSDAAIKVIKADTEEALAWRNGYFKFKSEPLPSVMLQLSRWYNVKVIYEGEIVKDRFGGTISRAKNIADVLEMLESTKLVKFKVEGRTIIVK